MADETPTDPVQEDPREEFFDNQPTDVEVEETESVREEGAATKPWNPSKIRISTKPFSLRQIVDMIDDHDIDLARLPTIVGMEGKAEIKTDRVDLAGIPRIMSAPSRATQDSA